MHYIPQINQTQQNSGLDFDKYIDMYIELPFDEGKMILIISTIADDYIKILQANGGLIPLDLLLLSQINNLLNQLNV